MKTYAVYVPIKDLGITPQVGESYWHFGTERYVFWLRQENKYREAEAWMTYERGAESPVPLGRGWIATSPRA